MQPGYPGPGGSQAYAGKSGSGGGIMGSAGKLIAGGLAGVGLANVAVSSNFIKILIHDVKLRLCLIF